MLGSISYMNSLQKAPVVQQTAKPKTADTAAGATVKQSAPTPPKTDTVTISKQAQTLLTNSKTYSPTEEATEPSYEKSTEARLGQR